MITIYIWKPANGLYGHTSMKVTGGVPRDSVYVSWWPNRNVSTFECTDARMYSYQDDVEAEGRDPDPVIRIDGLNETAIKTWWRDFRLTQDQWCTITLNCSVAVVRGLKAGGSDRFVSARNCHHNWSVWRPMTLLDYVKDLRRGLANPPRRSLVDVHRQWQETQQRQLRQGHPMLRVRAGGRYY